MALVAKVRLGIGAGPVLFSSLWIIVGQGKELYVGVRNSTGLVKLSIHGSGVCQVALTREYWNKISPAAKLPDRTIVRWKRAPPIKGPREVVSIFFPRDFQQPRLNGYPAKAVEKIAPAVPGKTVRLRLFETYLKPTHELLMKLTEFGQPIGHVTLDDDRSFLISASREPFDEKSVADILPGKGPLNLFHPEGGPAPGETIHGLSCLAWSDPKDGGMFSMIELHGIDLRRET